MSLQTVSITKFDVRPQYHLSNESQPYQSAINTIKSLPRAVTATEKLAILRAAAAKIVNCVVEYWKRQPLPEGQKRPETSVGGDELLPLMTYVRYSLSIRMLEVNTAIQIGHHTGSSPQSFQRVCVYGNANYR